MNINEENEFLKSQNQAFLILIDNYESLHFYYKELYSKKNTNDIFPSFLAYIHSLFKESIGTIHSALYLVNDETFDFEFKANFPDNKFSKDMFEKELNAQIQDGVIAWSLSNKKNSFITSHVDNKYNCIIIPIFTTKKIIGIVITYIECPAESITQDIHMVLQLSCTQTAMHFDNLIAYEKINEFSNHLQRLVDQQTKDLKQKTEDLEKTIIENKKAEEKKRQLEKELFQGEKLKSIGTMAAGIAHEINTPIQFVNDNQTFLQEASEELIRLITSYKENIKKIPNISETKEILENIFKLEQKTDLEFLSKEIPSAFGQSKEGLERVATIVTAMKNFSFTGGEDAKTPIDINKAIESTAMISRNEWKYVAELVMELDKKLPLTKCYPGDLKQVVLNMIVNASHAIAEFLGSNPKEKGKILIKTFKENNFFVITIKDTGAGIKKANKAKIFDPFFTTKEVGKGTGQGLSLAYSIIVKKHNGSLTFESEENKGTTFIIKLPKE